MARNETDGTSAPDTTADFKRYTAMFWRHKGIVALCFLTALCVAFIALEFVPKVYESQVTLMIRDSRLVTRDMQQIIGGILETPGGPRVDEQQIAQLAGRITSRPFLERVVRVLRLDEDPRIRARAMEAQSKHPDVSLDEMVVRILVGRMQSGIGVERRGMGIYRVTVGATRADDAQRFAQQICALFVDVSDEEMADDIKDARKLGSDWVETYNVQLRRAEDALERFKEGRIQRDLARSTIHSENLSLAESLQQRILEGASDARIRARSLRDSLSRRGIAPDIDALAMDSELDDLASALRSSFWNEVVTLVSTSVPGDVAQWPPQGAYGALRWSLLQRAERLAAQSFPDAKPGVINTISRYLFSKIDAEAQESAAEALGAEMADFRSWAVRGPRGETELASLEAAVAQARRLVQSAEEQVVGTELRGAVETAKMGLKTEIMDPATLPLAPSRPDRSKVLLAAALIGGLLGIGLAFIVEILDPVLRSTEDFARIIPEPILGTTPLLSRRLVVKQRWLRRHWVVAALLALALLTGVVFLLRGTLFGAQAGTAVPAQVAPGGVPNADR
jgi:polysaccharide biosynthesis transport protein